MISACDPSFQTPRQFGKRGHDGHKEDTKDTTYSINPNALCSSCLLRVLCDPAFQRLLTSSTPKPGFSEHDITPFFKIKPPETISFARSRLPSRSMYFVLLH